MDKKILKIEKIKTTLSSNRQSNSNRMDTADSQKVEEQAKPKEKGKKDKKKDVSKFGLKVRFSKDDGEVIIWSTLFNY